MSGASSFSGVASQHTQVLSETNAARAARAVLQKRATSEKGPAAAGFLDSAIQRLEEIIDQETAALLGHKAVDLKEFNSRKSHGLLELTRALRQIDEPSITSEIRARLKALRGKLEKNQAVLKTHLEAVREISTIISDAIRQSESDGTYSRPSQGARKQP